MAKKQFRQFSLGDKVTLIFTNETGTVIRILDAESVLVRLTDGDEIPAFNEHLHLIEKEQTISPPPKLVKQNTVPPVVKERQLTKEEAAKKLNEMGLHTYEDTDPDLGLHYAFEPFLKPDGMIEYFLVYFINNSPRSVSFTYETELNGDVVFTMTKTLASRDTIILNDIQLDWFNEKLFLIITGEVKITVNPEGNGPLQFEKVYAPKAKLLHKAPQLLPLLNKIAYSISILSNTSSKKTPENNSLQNSNSSVADPSELKLNMLLGKNKEDNNTPKTVINAEERVIDLHIEKLTSSYKHLSNSAILQIQLTAFEKSLNEAIKRQEKSMVAIHGKGTGKLRTEIFNILRNYPEVVNYANDYHPKYEFGATIITLQYET